VCHTFMNQTGCPSLVVPSRAWRNIFLKKRKFGWGCFKIPAAPFSLFHSCQKIVTNQANPLGSKLCVSHNMGEEGGGRGANIGNVGCDLLHQYEEQAWQGGWKCIMLWLEVHGFASWWSNLPCTVLSAHSHMV